MITDICPLCNSKGLRYSQNADISFKLVGKRLVPILEVDEIGWFDSTELFCPNCGANSTDNGKLGELLHIYDNQLCQ